MTEQMISKNPKKCRSNWIMMTRKNRTSRLKFNNSTCSTDISSTHLLLSITLSLTIYLIMFGQEVPEDSHFSKNCICSRISSMDCPERHEPILKQRRNRLRATLHLKSPFSSRWKKSSKLCSYSRNKSPAERRSYSILN